MRKLAIAAALSTTVLAGPALARDGAWYVGGDFGAMIVEDIEADLTPGATVGTTGLANLDFDYGYDGSGFVGYDLGSFRIEAEVSYKSADAEDIETSFSIGAPGGNAGQRIFPDSVGNLTVLSGMINGMLDFGEDDGLSGFVGGGVGIARVDFDGVGPFTNTPALVDGSDTRFAWQVVAGVRQAISRNIDVHLRYRFFNVADLEMSGLGNRSVSGDLRTHSLLGGITFNFGVPEPIPPCIAPNFLNEAGICVPPPVIVDQGPPPCPVGTFRNGAGVCEAPPVQMRDCPNGTRVPMSEQCPQVVLPPSIVYFGWDEDTLTDRARQTLQEVATNYRSTGQAAVTLAGHADKSGSAGYNVGLSQRRANNVRDYLVSLGVPGGSINSQAFGETRPAVETADGVREPDNRRVEISYGPGSGW